MRRPGTSYYPLALNVINLTGRFITGVETSSPDVVFPLIFSVRPDGFNGHDKQIKQFVQKFHSHQVFPAPSWPQRDPPSEFLWTLQFSSLVLISPT